MRDILDLVNSTDSVEIKAGRIADLIIADMDPDIQKAARRCAVLHWFTPELLRVFLPKNIRISYAIEIITSLPFVEVTPEGYAFHELTRRGLLEIFSLEVIKDACTRAAPVLLQNWEADVRAALEALFCLAVAGDSRATLTHLDNLILYFGRSSDVRGLKTAFDILNEAQKTQPATSILLRDYHILAREIVYGDPSDIQELGNKLSDALINKGLQEFGRGYTAKAIDMFNYLISLLPENYLGYYNRGILLQKLGDLNQAISDFSQAILLSPETPEIYHARGIVYYQQHYYAEAIADFDRSIWLSPYHVPSYYARGNAYYALGKFEQAISDFTQGWFTNTLTPTKPQTTS